MTRFTIAFDDRGNAHIRGFRRVRGKEMGRSCRITNGADWPSRQFFLLVGEKIGEMDKELRA
jgi:hypothetical protein